MKDCISSTDKNELRAVMKQKENEFFSDHLHVSGSAGIGDTISEVQTREIWSAVERSKEFCDARTVLVYMAVPGEVPTSGFIGKWKGKKRIAVPRVCGDNLALFLYDSTLMKPGYKGIEEPSDEAIRLEPDMIDLALVPGTAFTTDGLRLGRGKGFYDRLLPELSCPCCGICYSFRIVNHIPCDPWDVRLDKVFTCNTEY